MEKKEIKTKNLEKILQKTSLDDIDDVFSENEDSMVEPKIDFYNFIKERMEEKKVKAKDVFFDADISYRYGYKLVSGEKVTRQRDVIIRLCYALELSLDETQKALKLYGLPPLYAKRKRDAIMMLIFKDRPGDIIKFNEILLEKKEKPLVAVGED